MNKDDNRISAWLKLIERKMERGGMILLKDTGITVTQLRVMKYLMTHPEESLIADISEFFGVSHTSMVHVVNSLEEKGYVYREPIRRSRGKKIILTDLGKKLASENENRIDALEKMMISGFTKENQETLLQLLKRINDNLDEHFKK